MNDAKILSEELQSEDVRQRRRAGKMLAMLEQGAQPAIMGLLAGVADSDEEVCQWCSEALEMIGAPAIADAGKIADFIVSEKNQDALYFAISLLGRLGDSAAPFLTTLQSCTSLQCQSAVRARAIWALSRIANSENRSEILDHLKHLSGDSDSTVCAATTKAIAMIQS